MTKKIALYGILASLALIFGYIESLFSLSFIAPGVKLGLANSVALLLPQGFKGRARGQHYADFTLRLTFLLSLFFAIFPNRRDFVNTYYEAFVRSEIGLGDGLQHSGSGGA